MAYLGDRRSWVRFEVVGALAGALETVERAPILNISPTGILVSSSVTPVVDSRSIIRLMLGTEEVTVDARVCHFHVVEEARGARYLVGLEFLSSSPRLERAINQLVEPNLT